MSDFVEAEFYSSDTDSLHSGYDGSDDADLYPDPTVYREASIHMHTQFKGRSELWSVLAAANQRLEGYRAARLADEAQD